MKNFIKSLCRKTYKILCGTLAWITIFGFCAIYMPLVCIIQGLIIPIEVIVNRVRLGYWIDSYSYFSKLLQGFEAYSDLGEDMEEYLPLPKDEL